MGDEHAKAEKLKAWQQSREHLRQSAAAKAAAEAAPEGHSGQEAAPPQPEPETAMVVSKVESVCRKLVDCDGSFKLSSPQSQSNRSFFDFSSTRPRILSSFLLFECAHSICAVLCLADPVSKRSTQTNLSQRDYRHQRGENDVTPNL